MTDDRVWTTTSVTDHEFDPGDHAYIERDHLCHDCGKRMGVHTAVPEWVRKLVVDLPGGERD